MGRIERRGMGLDRGKKREGYKEGDERSVLYCTIYIMCSTEYKFSLG